MSHLAQRMSDSWLVEQGSRRAPDGLHFELVARGPAAGCPSWAWRYAAGAMGITGATRFVALAAPLLLVAAGRGAPADAEPLQFSLLAVGDTGAPPDDSDRYQTQLAVAADVPVHLVLAGHEHNLQVLAMLPPARLLHVIAGGGSEARSLYGPDPRRKVGFKVPGFARVDLVGYGAGNGEEARLVASLYGLPRFPWRLVSDRPRLVACWSVDRAGWVAEE